MYKGKDGKHILNLSDFLCNIFCPATGDVVQEKGVRVRPRERPASGDTFVLKIPSKAWDQEICPSTGAVRSRELSASRAFTVYKGYAK